MDKRDNLRLVRNVGDDIQLEYGNEFGYYAKNLTNDQLYKFCNEANFNDAIQESGFVFLACEDKETKKINIIAQNQTKRLAVQLKLLDNSLYFVANEKEWALIDEKMFKTAQNLWRNFMAKHNWEYQKNLNMLDVLNIYEPCYSL